MTECEIRVDTPSLPPAGVPIVGEETGEATGAVPIVLFSLIMHPSPMSTGPSKEYMRVRGWMTVSAPMAMGWVPWKTVVSAIVAVGWAVTGARREEVVEVRCWGWAWG